MKPGGERRGLSGWSLAGGLGLTWAASLVLGVMAGRWLDARVGSGSAFTLAGLLLGLGAAGLSTYRMLNLYLRSLR